jgi:hypothetical protein
MDEDDFCLADFYDNAPNSYEDDFFDFDDDTLTEDNDCGRYGDEW